MLATKTFTPLEASSLTGQGHKENFVKRLSAGSVWNGNEARIVERPTVMVMKKEYQKIRIPGGEFRYQGIRLIKKGDLLSRQTKRAPLEILVF